MIWSSSDDAQLRTLHAEGMSYRQIGARLGVSRCAISGRVWRLKDVPKRDQSHSANMRWHDEPTRDNRSPTQWTDDMVDQLCALHSQGKTWAGIAGRLNVTKSAAISKGRELGLRHKPAPPPKPHFAWPKPFSYRVGTVTAPTFIAVSQAPGAIPVPLWERTGCCFPVEYTDQHLFCNAPADGSYCEFHRSKMYRVPV